MSDITYEILKIVAMICVLLITRYLIPWIKSEIGTDKIDMATEWIKNAVLFAQQTMWAKSGTDRKRYVVNFITKLCEDNNVPLTEEQIDVILESCVKQMKIEENANTTIKISSTVKE